MKWVSNLWETIPGTPGQRTLTILLGVLSVLFIAVMVCKPVETCITQLLDTGGKYETLRALGFGMGGILVVLQFLIANRRAYAMEETAKAQVKATQEQAKANENTDQGQRQERLKNAIENLGHTSDSVRLGGAYELFHLAQDTPKLRQTVLDILCAHIRRTTGETEYKKDHPSQPSEEIQSLLTLLFVQERKVFIGLDINLEGSWLNGSNLSQARLEKASLVGAQLHGASLVDTRLHGAQLWGAQLHGAYLSSAQLYGASLVEAQLYGASLVEAQLHGAHLIETRLCGANLWNAQLHETRLWSTDLRGVNGFPGGVNDSFEVAINRRIGWESDLDTVIFAGGLTPEDVASIGTGLFDEDAKSLREKLKAHIEEAESHELPDNSGPFGPMSDPSIVAYAKEDAAQWIAEYKTATSAVSGSEG